MLGVIGGVCAIVGVILLFVCCRYGSRWYRLNRSKRHAHNMQALADMNRMRSASIASTMAQMPKIPTHSLIPKMTLDSPMNLRTPASPSVRSPSSASSSPVADLSPAPRRRKSFVADAASGNAYQNTSQEGLLQGASAPFASASPSPRSTHYAPSLDAMRPSLATTVYSPHSHSNASIGSAQRPSAMSPSGFVASSLRLSQHAHAPDIQDQYMACDPNQEFDPNQAPPRYDASDTASPRAMHASSFSVAPSAAASASSSKYSMSQPHAHLSNPALFQPLQQQQGQFQVASRVGPSSSRSGAGRAVPLPPSSPPPQQQQNQQQHQQQQQSRRSQYNTLATF